MPDELDEFLALADAPDIEEQPRGTVYRGGVPTSPELDEFLALADAPDIEPPPKEWDLGIFGTLSTKPKGDGKVDRRFLEEKLAHKGFNVLKAGGQGIFEAAKKVAVGAPEEAAPAAIMPFAEWLRSGGEEFKGKGQESISESVARTQTEFTPEMREWMGLAAETGVESLLPGGGLIRYGPVGKAERAAKAAEEAAARAARARKADIGVLERAAPGAGPGRGPVAPLTAAQKEGLAQKTFGYAKDEVDLMDPYRVAERVGDDVAFHTADDQMAAAERAMEARQEGAAQRMADAKAARVEGAREKAWFDDKGRRIQGAREQAHAEDVAKRDRIDAKREAENAEVDRALAEEARLKREQEAGMASSAREAEYQKKVQTTAEDIRTEEQLAAEKADIEARKVTADPMEPTGTPPAREQQPLDLGDLTPSATSQAVPTADDATRIAAQTAERMAAEEAAKRSQAMADASEIDLMMEREAARAVPDVPEAPPRAPEQAPAPSIEWGRNKPVATDPLPPRGSIQEIEPDLMMEGQKPEIPEEALKPTAPAQAAEEAPMPFRAEGTKPELVVGGDPANFREGSIDHLIAAVKVAEDKGLIPRYAFLGADPPVERGRYTVTPFRNPEGEVVGFTRTRRFKPASEGPGGLEAEFFPVREGMNWPQAVETGTFAPGSTAPLRVAKGAKGKPPIIEDPGQRYFHQPGGATATAPQTTKPPRMGYEQATREAEQRMRTPIRAADVGELPGSAAGEYKFRPEVIVSKWQANPETVAHEIGHHVEKMLFGGKKAGVLGASQDLAKHGKFLDSLGAGKGGNSRAEGMAEAIRLYVNDPAALEQTAEGIAFKKFLQSEIRARDPRMMNTLDRLQENVQAIRGATPGDRIGLDIAEADRQASGKVPAYSNLNPVEQQYVNWVDYHYPGAKMTEQAKSAGLVKDATKDFAVRARAFRAFGSEVKHWLEFGVPETNIPGLHSIYEVAQDIPALNRYSAAKFTVAKGRSSAIGRNSSYDDAVKFVQEMEGNAANKSIVDAYKLRNQWNEAALRKYHESGLMDSATFKKRVQEIRNGSPLTDDVLNNTPTLASEAKRAIDMLHEVNQNELGKILYDYSKGEGMGRWVEKFDNPNAAVKEGRVKVEVKNLNRGVKGMDETVTLHVDKDVWRAVDGLTPLQRDWFHKWLVQGSAEAFRKGVTGHVLFGSYASARAVLNSMFTSRAQKHPLEAFVNALSGFKSSFTRDKWFKQALADKALNTGFAAIGLADTEKQIAALSRTGLFWDSMKKLSTYVGPEMSTTLENSVRLGEYKALFNRLARENPTMSEAARRVLAADAARAVDVDMLTRGAGTRYMAAISPFWNPAAQGVRNDIQNIGRLFKTDPKQAMVRLGAFTVPSVVAWAWSKDDPRIHAMSPEMHARYEFISIGEGRPLIKIPRAQGIAGQWTASVRLLLDALYRGDKDVMNKVAEPWKEAVTGLIPLNNPLLKVGWEVGSKTKSDLNKLGEDVVPKYRQDEPEMKGRFNPVQNKRIANTMLGSQAGGAVNWGMDVMGFGDTNAETAKSTVDKIPVVNKFVSSGDVNYPAGLQDFQNRIKPLKEIEENAAWYKKNRPQEWRSYVEKNQDKLREFARLKGVDKWVGEMRKKADAITNSQLPDAEKRQRLNALWMQVEQRTREALKQ